MVLPCQIRDLKAEKNYSLIDDYFFVKSNELLKTHHRLIHRIHYFQLMTCYSLPGYDFFAELPSPSDFGFYNENGQYRFGY